MTGFRWTTYPIDPKSLSKFRGRLAIEQIDSRRWRLLEPLAYGEFNAPEGYITDLATTPRSVWWLYPASGDYSPATVIHDLLLTDTNLPHREIDKIFRLMLADLGVPWPRRWILWTGVRWGSLTRSKAARKDWLRDAPLILAWSIPMAALLLLPTISISLSMLVVKLVEILTPDTANDDSVLIEDSLIHEARDERIADFVKHAGDPDKDERDGIT